MPNEKQIELLEKVQTILLRKNIMQFSMKNSTRGFLLVDPRIKENYAFLGTMSEKSGRDTLNQGIVVAAIGFGNLDHEFPKAKEAVERYQKFLGEENIASEIILNSPEDMLNRGAYLFVPCQSFVD